MTRTVLNLIVILAMTAATPAWSDDVRAVAQDVASDKGARDRKAAEAEATYLGQYAAIMKECEVDASNEKPLYLLLQSWDEATKSIVASVKKEAPDLAEKLAVIDKEIEDARQSNNADQTQELIRQRTELVDLMSGWDPETRRQLGDVDAKYHGAVREMVPEGKHDRLDEILETAQETQHNRPRRGPVRSPRALKAIVDRLGDLTPEQRRSIDGVFLQFRESRRERRGQSPENSADERKLYDDVFAVLTDGQKTRVEQQLAGRATGAAQAAPNAGVAPGAAAHPATGTESKEPNKPAAPAVPAAKGTSEKP